MASCYHPMMPTIFRSKNTIQITTILLTPIPRWTNLQPILYRYIDWTILSRSRRDRSGMIR